MKGIALILLGALLLHTSLTRLFMSDKKPVAIQNPQDRKAILTWDSQELVNRKNDQMQCELTSPRGHDRNAARQPPEPKG